MMGKRKPNGGACLVAVVWIGAVVAESLMGYALGMGIIMIATLIIVKVI